MYDMLGSSLSLYHFFYPNANPCYRNAGRTFKQTASVNRENIKLIMCEHEGDASFKLLHP